MALTTLLLIGAGVSAGGALLSGIQQKRMSQYNASLARIQADTSRKKATFDARRQREMTKKLLATQRARFGKAGLGLEGSPLLVMEETVREGELDARAIEYSGELAAAGHESSANLRRFEGNMAMTSAVIGAGTSLLSGISQYKRETGGYPKISGSK